MFTCFTPKDFSIEKDELQIENRKGIVIICAFVTNCNACGQAKSNLNTLPSTFPDISFGYINIDTYPEMKDLFEKMSRKTISYVPTFLLFKLGIFSKILEMNELSETSVKTALSWELNADSLKSSNAEFAYIQNKNL